MRVAEFGTNSELSKKALSVKVGDVQLNSMIDDLAKVVANGCPRINLLGVRVNNSCVVSCHVLRIDVIATPMSSPTSLTYSDH